MYAKVINDKHEDVMAKFGAIIAQGIIDAGWLNIAKVLLHVFSWNISQNQRFLFKLTLPKAMWAFAITWRLLSVVR